MNHKTKSHTEVQNICSNTNSPVQFSPSVTSGNVGPPYGQVLIPPIFPRVGTLSHHFIFLINCFMYNSFLVTLSESESK